MTTQPDTPRAPKGLGARGRGFWRAVTARFELERHELEILIEIARCLDDLEGLQGVLATEGPTTIGSKGQTRAHPVLGEIRAARLVLGRLLAQLALPDDATGEHSITPTRTIGGRAGARARWATRRHADGPA